MNDFQSQCSVAGYVSTPEDGILAEEVGADGEHRFAALGWADAGFVHTLHVRAGISDRVSG
jgi:hypothetical protein